MTKQIITKLKELQLRKLLAKSIINLFMIIIYAGAAYLMYQMAGLKWTIFFFVANFLISKLVRWAFENAY